jgi:hypothetical protein
LPGFGPYYQRKYVDDIIAEEAGRKGNPRGLALQAAAGSFLKTNLLPREITTDRIIESKKPWAVAALVGLLASLKQGTGGRRWWWGAVAGLAWGAGAVVRMRRFGAEGGVCLGAVVVLWQAAPGPAARGCSLGRALGAARVRGAEAGSRPAATRLLLLRPKQPGFALARGGTHGAQPCAWRPKTRRRWQRAVLPNALCDGVTPFKPLPGIRSKPESVRVLARTRWGWDARYGVLSRWGWRGDQVFSVTNTTPPTTGGR